VNVAPFGIGRRGYLIEVGQVALIWYGFGVSFLVDERMECFVRGHETSPDFSVAGIRAAVRRRNQRMKGPISAAFSGNVANCISAATSSSGGRE
jgi:hypothetical protein